MDSRARGHSERCPFVTSSPVCQYVLMEGSENTPLAVSGDSKGSTLCGARIQESEREWGRGRDTYIHITRERERACLGSCVHCSFHFYRDQRQSPVRVLAVLSSVETGLGAGSLHASIHDIYRLQ